MRLNVPWSARAFWLLHGWLVIAAVAGCASEYDDPGTFEPGDQPVLIRGCEEYKQRNPEADC